MLAWSFTAHPPLGPVRFCLFCPLFSGFPWHVACCVSLPRGSAFFCMIAFFHLIIFGFLVVTGSAAGPILLEEFFGGKASFPPARCSGHGWKFREWDFQVLPCCPGTHTVPLLCPCLALTSLLLAGLLFITFLPCFFVSVWLRV